MGRHIELDVADGAVTAATPDSECNANAERLGTNIRVLQLIAWS